MTRSITQEGLDLIKSFEGLSLTAYPDIVGVYTIGYGHTQGVHPGQIISEDEAERLLSEDLDKFEAGVSKLLAVAVNDDQFAALVSLAYNIGLGNFQRSTLLRMVNRGDFKGAANEFPRWNRAGGKVVDGLTRRRLAEQKLFQGDKL